MAEIYILTVWRRGSSVWFCTRWTGR